MQFMQAKLVTVPNPLLAQKSAVVKQINRPIKRLAKTMTELIANNGQRTGVGLSAVQIGKPIQLFVVYNPQEKKNYAFINPQITWKSKVLTKGVPDREFKHEGCLSIPGIFGLVKRHSAIKVRYQNLKNQTKIEKFTGFLATVIQHEYDHLNGILFTQRVLEQNGQLYKLEKEKLVPVKL